MKTRYNIINQIFEIEKKVAESGLEGLASRNFERLKHEIETEYNLIYRDPIGEKYNESRIDCEASIVGDDLNDLVISKTIKPLIYQKDNTQGLQLVQRAVVIVEPSKKGLFSKIFNK